MRLNDVLRTAAVMIASIGSAGASEAGDAAGALLAKLRGGSHVIYVRHAQTDWSQTDRVERPGDWLSCDPGRIRQLSDEGRATARRVGAAMRAIAVPISTVLASPYCRTVETARLMELGPVETTVDVMNLRVAEHFGGRGAIAASARRLIARPPATGTNTLVVAHGNVAREATAVYPGEMESLVFLPDGAGGFDLVGRLTPEDWTRLASESR